MNGRSEQLNRALRVQNARLREVVELLASRLAVVDSRNRSAERPIELRVFEEFAEVAAPRPRSLPSSSRRVSNFQPVRDNDFFPAFPSPIQALDPSPGWRCLSENEAPLRIGFTLFGLKPDEVEERVATVESRQLRDRDFLPLFITDVESFDSFRSRGYTFEYIPRTITASPRSMRSERRYLEARLELIRSKWRLRDLVDLA
jgi:hypothetical protein